MFGRLVEVRRKGLKNCSSQIDIFILLLTKYIGFGGPDLYMENFKLL